MGKAYKLTQAELSPLHRGKGVYEEIVSDFLAQGTETMRVSVEGMKPATPRAGLRRALKGNEDVKMAQRQEATYLIRASAKDRS